MNLSTYEFCVGLPGEMNFNSTPFFSAQSAMGHRNELRSVIHPELGRVATPGGKPFQHPIALAAGRLVSTSMARASRLKSSNTLNVRIVSRS